MSTITITPRPTTPREIIERIVTRRERGETYQHIADALNADGLTTATGLSWTRSRARDLLKVRGISGKLTPARRIEIKIRRTRGGHRLWTGKTNDKGYGLLIVDGRTIPAHRWAWVREYGDIPEGGTLVNTCGRRNCLTPAHWKLRLSQQLSFDSFIRPHPDSTCLLWTGSRDRDGYGILRKRQGGALKARSAHREAYERHYGPIPEGWQLHHLCYQPPCVNPAHLVAVPGSSEHHGLEKDQRTLTEAIEGGSLYVELAVHSAFDDSHELTGRIGALDPEEVA